MNGLTWRQINTSYLTDHRNILGLIDLVLCLPSSSAVCEQGFSRMKFTKTDWRNRLLSSSLTDQLVIMLHTSEIEDYAPTEAVLLWHTAGPRKRRCCTYKKALPVTCDPESHDIISSEDELENDIDETECY